MGLKAMIVSIFFPPKCPPLRRYNRENVGSRLISEKFDRAK